MNAARKPFDFVVVHVQAAYVLAEADGLGDGLEEVVGDVEGGQAGEEFEALVREGLDAVIAELEGVEVVELLQGGGHVVNEVEV